jgi:hypothetical protein
MRAFIEAAAVEDRFRNILWEMRARHVKRFCNAYRRAFGDTTLAGVSIEVATEAVVCMVEQCCYVWFAHEDLSDGATVEEAIAINSHAWYAAIFGGTAATSAEVQPAVS